MFVLSQLGQCGFPGKPLNGKVFIEDSEQLGRNVFNSPEPTAAPQPVVSDRSVAFNSTEKYDHMRLTTKFTQEINESNWKTGKLYRVAYRCDVDLLVDKDGGNGHFRECVNGRWTGNIPQCGEFRTEIQIHL